MILNGLDGVDKHPDLLIQTVSTPSIASEKKLIIEDGMIINLGKSDTIEAVVEYCDIKSGGMVYLWFKDPFPLIEASIASGNYQSSQFLKTVMQRHTVLEMAINDMWDVDTYEDVLQTEKILRLLPQEMHST